MPKGSYRVDIASRRVEKQLKNLLKPLEPSQRQEVIAAIEALGHNPRPLGIKKIKDDIHRIRFGDWRVVFTIREAERVVVILKAGRREKDFYQEFR